jgi:hypothetical protein
MGNDIIFSDKVIDYLEKLTNILIDKEYFLFFENAENYVSKIVDDIHFYIPLKRKRDTPLPLRKHGKYYIILPADKRTSWYVFFEYYNGRYFIQYITNNHSAKASFINRLK